MTEFESIARPPIHVVAGVLRDTRGRVLLAQRASGKEWAGSWEFPGGKVEPGEIPAHALARELDEELGIRARIGCGLIAIPHGKIVLDVFEVSDFSGRIHSREGQALAWVDPAHIDRSTMPAADRPVVAALRLPDRYLITPTDVAGNESVFLASIEQALNSGIRLIQLRLPGWPRSRLAPLARLVRERCAAHAAELLLHADWELAEVLGLDGVHLPAHIAQALRHRPLGDDRWLGVSCHNAEELAHATSIGADFATLSPIHFTPSHTQGVPLGWERAVELIAAAALPVYMLGGMQLNECEIARRYGAQGIAAIRSLWPG